MQISDKKVFFFEKEQKTLSRSGAGGAGRVGKPVTPNT